MVGKILFVTLLGLCCANFFDREGLNRLGQMRKGVERFSMHVPEENEVENKAQDLLGKLTSSLLLRGSPLGSTSSRLQQLLPLLGLKHPSHQVGGTSGRPQQLTAFNIANCSSSQPDKTKFVIRTLDILPSPVAIPGTLTFAFNINVVETIIDDLTANLELKVKVGETYIKVPCIEDIGSCAYKVCELLDNVQQCPQKLVDDKIPCKCPLDKNVYVEPGISATIDAAVFAPSDYKAEVNLAINNNTENIGCYTASFTIE